MIEAVGTGNGFRLPTSGGEGVTPTPPPDSRRAGGQYPVTSVAGTASPAALKGSIEKGDGARENGDVDDGAVFSEKELEAAIDRINEKMSGLHRELQFKMDKKLSLHYVSVVDTKTKEVVREFPPKEIRSLMARLREFADHTKGGEEINLLINLKV